MKLGIDPKVDFAFKRLFGAEKNRAILISLIHAVLQLPPERQIVEIQILNPFSIKEAQDDKLSIVDIMAMDQGGRQYYIEMQMVAPSHFPKRILYYWARRHQQQLLEGEEYATLKPTIGICFVNSVLFREASGCHMTFRLVSEVEKLVLCEDMEIHLLQLPRFLLTEAELVTPLDKWLYFLRHAEDLDPEKLPLLLDTPEFHYAVEDLKMLTQDQKERELYESRFKKLHDDNYWRRYPEIMRAEGRAEGRAEARAEALAGTVLMCQRLLHSQESSIDDLMRLPVDELQKLCGKLEKELEQKLAQA